MPQAAMTEGAARATRLLGGRYWVVLLLGATLLSAYYFQYLARGGAPRTHSAGLCGLCFIGLAVRPLLVPQHFRRALLLLSLVGCVLWSGLDSLVIFAFVAVVIAVSRARIPISLRVLTVLLAWFSVLAPKLWLDRSEIVRHMPLFIYWAGIPFAALYLVIERSRGSLREANWADDALYMLALPRLLSPFIQAISPSKFLASQASSKPELKLLGRGLGLGLYGVALVILMAKFPYIPPPRPDVQADPRFIGVLSGPHNTVFVYAANASAIFCAVGMFRVLGFDLASGFRWPLLSTSFADFYRRWNHYVYDSVKSLFFFPLLGWLRRFLPDVVAAVVGGYLAIFLGSFCLSVILVPLALDPNPGAVLKRAFDADLLLVHGVFWSAIMLPQLIPRRASKTTPSPAGQLLRRAVFLAVVMLLTSAAYDAGVILL